MGWLRSAINFCDSLPGRADTSARVEALRPVVGSLARVDHRPAFVLLARFVGSWQSDRARRAAFAVAERQCSTAWDVSPRKINPNKPWVATMAVSVSQTYADSVHCRTTAIVVPRLAMWNGSAVLGLTSQAIEKRASGTWSMCCFGNGFEHRH